MANDRLRALEDVEKEIAVVLQCAGTIVLELSKEKHNASLLDRQLNQFQTSINRIESELSSQIRYLTQVATGQPHEGSTYSARKDCQMALNRAEYARVKLGELRRTWPLDREKVACTLQVGGEVLPQVQEFKYLGVLFTGEGRMDREIDRWIGAAAAVMRSMYRSVVVKKELSRKAKLSIYQSIYVPTLTYGHELWVMTERVRSRIQVAEMNFLRRVAGRSLRDRVRSSVTREELGVEPLLLHIERGQLRWLGHLFQMHPGRLPGEVFRACPTGKRPRGRPRTHWRDYVSRLAWERLGVPPEELEEVSEEREVWVCCPRDPAPDKRKTMNE
ncbi:hypothetical protein QTP86_025157 [Hemibagrus guttatus]|nr:hypothetical protein QTP86_025157 [Hemibagrus guttatus]